MPESFNDRSPTRTNAPKPARLGGSQGVTNDMPSASGVAAGGLDNIRGNEQCFEASDSRAKTSPLRATRAPVDHFSDAVV